MTPANEQFVIRKSSVSPLGITVGRQRERLLKADAFIHIIERACNRLFSALSEFLSSKETLTLSQPWSYGACVGHELHLIDPDERTLAFCCLTTLQNTFQVRHSILTTAIVSFPPCIRTSTPGLVPNANDLMSINSHPSISSVIMITIRMTTTVSPNAKGIPTSGRHIVQHDHHGPPMRISVLIIVPSSISAHPDTSKSIKNEQVEQKYEPPQRYHSWCCESPLL